MTSDQNQAINHLLFDKKELLRQNLIEMMISMFGPTLDTKPGSRTRDVVDKATEVAFNTLLKPC